MRRALSHYPPTFEYILRAYEPLKSGQGRLVDIIVGFVDPNAPDVIAEPHQSEAGREGSAGSRGRRRSR